MGARKTAKAKDKGRRRRREAARRAARQAAKGEITRSSPQRAIVYQESQYAIEQSTNTKAGRNKAYLLFVIFEALRIDGYCDHLYENDFIPQDPEFIDIGEEGAPAGILSVEDGKAYYKELLKMAGNQVEYHLRADGAWKTPKQRVNTTILGTAIASWPGDPDAEYDNPDFKRWLKATVLFAKRKYGRHLKGAILHRDEGALHLHLWYDNDGKNVKVLQAGQVAAAAALKAGCSSEDAGNACKAADKALLDQYHAEVGVKCGLARTGDHPKPKLNRREYLELKAKERLDKAEADELDAAKLRKGRMVKADRTIEHLKQLQSVKRKAKHLPELYEFLFGNGLAPDLATITEGTAQTGGGKAGTGLGEPLHPIPTGLLDVASSDRVGPGRTWDWQEFVRAATPVSKRAPAAPEPVDVLQAKMARAKKRFNPQK